MDDGIRNYPRSTVAYGDDCTVEFVRRADNDKAVVDVWRITMSGQQFDLHMMRMRRKPDSHPWVFGSITELSLRKQMWSFRDDQRVVNRGFVGDVFTEVGVDGCTYVSYQLFGTEKYRILLSELLRVVQPVVTPAFMATATATVSVLSDEEDFELAESERIARWEIPPELADHSPEMASFVNQVLRWM